MAAGDDPKALRFNSQSVNDLFFSVASPLDPASSFSFSLGACVILICLYILDILYIHDILQP